MKELREILSRSVSGATSAATSAISSSTVDEEPSDCPLCGGAGFIRRQRALDDPLFGRVEPCSCRLEEAASERQSRLERLSNLGSLVRFTFDRLRTENAPASFRKAVAEAQAFAVNPAGWLFLHGAGGSGKTHIAAAIANERIQAGQPVLFFVAADLLDRLRASYTSDESEEPGDGFDATFDQVRNTPLLILDDIDAISATAWAKEKLAQVISHRYNALLPTVITATQRGEALDERIASKLLDPNVTRQLLLETAPKEIYRQVGGMARERLAEMAFRDFDLAGAGLQREERDSLQAAFRSAMTFAENPRGWLVLQGSNGCGKTHLAAAIANKVLADGTGVFFAVVPDLLDALRSGFAPGKEGGFDELFDQVRNAPLLVLDDFGAQRSATWAEEKLYQIVNYRTISELPGVITTDRSINELQSAYPRIVSRVTDPREGNMLAILAPHYRLGRSFTAASSPSGPRRRGPGA